MVKPWSRCYYTVWALLAVFVVIGAFGMSPGGQGAMSDALQLTRQGVLQGEERRLDHVRHVYVVAHAAGVADVPPSAARSVVDRLSTKSLGFLTVVLHGFEHFGGVPLPLGELARDPQRLPGAE